MSIIKKYASGINLSYFSKNFLCPLDSSRKMKYFLCKHLHSRRSGGRMESKMRTYLQINPKDNVAVALAPLSSGTAIELDGISLTLAEDIPQGHKFALKQIPEDGQVIKYGCPIGIAKEDILPGHWVHIHNIKTGLGDLLTYTYDRKVTEPAPSEERFFQGYRRA